MNLPEFLSAVEDVFVVENKGSLTPDTPLEGIGVMDSMAMLELQALADEKFSVLLEPTDIIACKTVGDLCKLVKLAPDA